MSREESADEVLSDGSAWVRLMDLNVEPPGSSTGKYRWFKMNPEGSLNWSDANVEYYNPFPFTGKVRVDEMFILRDFVFIGGFAQGAQLLASFGATATTAGARCPRRARCRAVASPEDDCGSGVSGLRTGPRAPGSSSPRAPTGPALRRGTSSSWERSFPIFPSHRRGKEGRRVRLGDYLTRSAGSPSRL